jgi:ketosteroid isomerase-like protein
MVSAEGQTAQEGLIEEWIRRMSSHDIEGLLSLFADEVVYEDVAAGAVNHGKRELRAFFERNLASGPDMTFELASKVATEGRGAAE